MRGGAQVSVDWAIYKWCWKENGIFYDFMIEQFTDQAISLVQAANNGYKEKA